MEREILSVSNLANFANLAFLHVCITYQQERPVVFTSCLFSLSKMFCHGVTIQTIWCNF